MEPFHLAHLSFLCLSQIGWKQNHSFRGEPIALNQWDNWTRRSIQTLWQGYDLLSSTWNQRAIWSAGKLVPRCEWNLSKSREVSSRWVTDADCFGEEEKTKSKYGCLTYSTQLCGLWMHSEWSREVSEVRRSARNQAKGKHRGYRSHILYVETQCAVGVHNGATTGSITHWLLEGSVCIKRPGTEVDQCRLQRGPTYQTRIVHIRSRSCHAWTYTHPLVIFYFPTSPRQSW